MSNEQSGQFLLRVRNLTKYYFMGGERFSALSNVTFDFRHSSLTGIAGPSGSGKSTLLNILGTLDVPSQGEVIFGETHVNYNDTKQLEYLRQKKIGFIFQNFNLIPVLTAQENVELALLMHGISAKECTENAYGALKMVGLEDRCRYLPSQLSGGQQQRVAVARALVKKPLLVLADEPTANLDSTNTRNLIDIILKINKDLKTSFLISSHDHRILDELHEVIQLQDGIIIK